jgi:SAM-dependent methyltransferase
MTDESNGYEQVADIYSKSRSNIGSSAVRSWAQSFHKGAGILDLACGTGFPVTQLLLNEGLNVYALDASPSMIAIYRNNFPGIPTACEPVERSTFFNRTFDGIIAIGLIFLLPEETQRTLLTQLTTILNPGGKLLFTSPYQKITWTDVLTGHPSRSLGATEYRSLLSIKEEFTDEGENYYFSAVK